MDHKDKPAILFIVQLPPPLHGASMMNRIIVDSPVIKARFRTDTVNLHFVDTVRELGKFAFSKLWKSAAYAFEIIRKVRRLNPDLVYLNLTPKGFAFYRDSMYVLILKILRKKIVFHLQSKGIQENVENSLIKKQIYKFVLSNTSLICLSPMLASDFDQVYKSEPYYIPNGVVRHDSDSQPIIRDDTSSPVIMYLSHLLIDKGIMVLIDALEILRDKGYKFTARIIGPSADLTVEQVKEIIVRRKLDHVTEVLGPKYGDDKFNEFRNADIFVFPTLNEVFGLVILEAMQFSLPVVASIEGAIPDIISDGITGCLVEKSNPVMLADRLAGLLADGDLRRRMGQEGHKLFLEKYTIDKFEQNILATLETILNDKK